MKPTRSMQAQARHVIEVTLAGFALAGAASLAQAQTSSDAPGVTSEATMKASFARADGNGDSKLSREEAKRLPAISARFDELDTDHDGFLSYSEFVAAVVRG